MFVDEKLVQGMKERFPEGTRIVLDHMGDDPRPMAVKLEVRDHAKSRKRR